jgi:hypothetical protein
VFCREMNDGMKSRRGEDNDGGVDVVSAKPDDTVF